MNLHCWSHLRAFLRDEDGPTATEYAVLLALILMLCFVTIGTMGTKVNSAFAALNSKVEVPS